MNFLYDRIRPIAAGALLGLAAAYLIIVVRAFGTPSCPCGCDFETENEWKP